MQVLADTRKMSRDDWLEARKQGIGGSDVAAITGLSKYASPITVYLDKLGEFPAEREENEFMYWGTVLEEVVAREFAKRTGLKVKKANKIFQHKKYPWMIANVDRLVIGQKVGLEIKTASEYTKDSWAEGKIPNQYMLQVQHYMAVTGYQSWWIAVLIGGNRYHHQMIPRDNEIIRYITKIEADFWQLVQDKTPPALDGSEASSKVLRLLYADPKDDEILLPAEADQLVNDYLEAKEQVNYWVERKSTAQNQLENMLGNAIKGKASKHLVLWKPNKRGTRIFAIKEAKAV